MSIESLGKRLNRLDGDRPLAPTVYLFRYDDETDEQAIAQWHAQNPGENLEGKTVTMLMWGAPT
jgi:hypothetical protein